MNLLDVVRRTPAPVPWSEGDNIPWDDPGFSARMLGEHLSQAHDAASRRSETIDAHVDWIHRRVLEGKPSRILDLGCGPGFYTARFAALGHHPRGIDFGPASIAFANRHSSVEHRLEDVRSAEFGIANDLVMMIYGELNVFRPSDAGKILSRATQSLTIGGRLLLEVHTPEAIERLGSQPATWKANESGLFSDRPHLLLTEHLWDDAQRAATIRYFVIDAESEMMTHYSQSLQQYSLSEYETVLNDAGLHLDFVVDALDGSDEKGDFIVLVASQVPHY